MQLGTTTLPGPPTETVLTIRVSRNADHFIAEWSTGWIGGRDFRGETVVAVIGTVLDSIWKEGTRQRRPGRPSRRTKKMERLVRSRVGLVIEIESTLFDSLRTAGPRVDAVLVPQQVWPTTTSDRVH